MKRAIDIAVGVLADRGRSWALLGSLVVLPTMIFFPGSLRAGDATMPSASAATQPVTAEQMARLTRLLARLGDDDPDIRESAKSSLLSLNRDDLAALGAAVKSGPLPGPGEIADLHEIVRQVYLSGEPYPSTDQGFLGLHWFYTGEITDVLDDTGVIVDECLPGFCANRMLRPGDIIEKIIDQPDLDLHNRGNFITAMAAMHAGQEVRLKVLRQCRVINVIIIMDAKPVALKDAVNLDQFCQSRIDKSEQYWIGSFGWLDAADPATIGEDAAPAEQNKAAIDVNATGQTTISTTQP